MLKRNKNSVINDIKDDIRNVYLETKNTPWIIGYSGGKDSTTVLQLTIEVLLALQKEGLANKDVYVISADTLVENPLVINNTLQSMDRLKQFAKDNEIPLHVEMVYPKFNNTFLVNTIGKGYPSPLQSFRWCTDRIKIQPANDFIFSKINENGEVILLLGTREEESSSRKRSMDKHKIVGSSLSMHGSIDDAFTFAPIAMLGVNDIWSYLLQNPSPWGDDNTKLYALYSNSNADGECPLVIDEETKNQGSCGNSRFGCWTCTVVQEDKSLTGFIKNGEKWLTPFLKYRKHLLDIRDVATKRNLFGNRGELKLVDVKPPVNGKIIIPKKINRDEESIDESEVVTEEQLYDMIKSGYDPRVNTTIMFKNEKYYRVGVSGFTPETRVELLVKLFQTEEAIRRELPDYEIIKREEIIEIEKLWKSYGYVNFSAIDIYNQCHKKKIVLEKSNIDYNLIKEVSHKYSLNNEAINKIVFNTKQTNGLKNRNANIKYIEKVLSEHKTYLEGNNDNK
ncbi:DNA phosphorothioation system sulfurtransferase DndC [Mollicutes bacterium LVI A0039]|nr:DNA phosphorothioation system sulfurtransferase DndC [Mollicutes bacterium LVI A0039]